MKKHINVTDEIMFADDSDDEVVNVILTASPVISDNHYHLAMDITDVRNLRNWLTLWLKEKGDSDV